MTAPSAELIEQAVTQRSAGVWHALFAVELNTDATESRWVLMTRHSKPVVFDGETYHPWRVRLPRVETGAPGSLPAARLEVSNSMGVAAGYLRQFEGLRGRRLVIRLVNSLHLDSADHALVDTYEIADSRVDIGTAVLTLSKAPLHRMTSPSRRYARLICGVRFREALCGWTADKAGDEDACDHGLDSANGCVAHNNEARFGGQPAMPGSR